MGPRESDDEGWAALMADLMFDGDVDIDPERLWPVCPVHDFGPHPEVHDGRAVWWCNGDGGHALGEIGSLVL